MTRYLPLFLLALAACSDKPGPDTSVEDTGPFVTDVDGDGYEAEQDCDDEDPLVNPGALEACDGLDNDCDGTADDGVGDTFYTDADGDTYGDESAPTVACTQPEGTATQVGDCNDNDASTYPDAGERCDGVDNDCDGSIDEDINSTWYADQDGDLHGDPAAMVDDCDPGPGFVATALDCDDSRSDVNPDASEVCDGADNDCDGGTDESVTSTYYLDSDGDGFGDVDFSTQACSLPSGYAENSTDCNDSTAQANPGATELCDDLDNDCDGNTDEDDAADATTWYIDYDKDGYGATTYTMTQCDQPSGYVTDSSDCNDARAKTYPGAPEYCDKIDSDCDGTLDEGDALDADTYYADSDGDTYGDASTTTTSCTTVTGYVSDSSDCDDSVSTAYPGSTSKETPLDGIDTDCDGNDYCTDLNCDGRPDLALAQQYSGTAHKGSLYLYMNTGSGFSSSSVTTLTSYSTYDMEVDDLDGDGYLDIILANYYDGSTYSVNSAVYWGSSAGYSVGDRTDLATVGATRVSVADFNNDGYKDLVFANYYNGSYNLNSYVYYGSASGFSTAYRSSLATYGPWPMETEDFNGDGYEDILFACHYSGSSYSCNSALWWGSSSGFSSSNVSSLPTLGAYDIEIVDINKDGYSDIAFANYTDGSTNVVNSYVYYGSASGFSTSYRTSLPTYGAISVDSGDIDGDGYIDLVFSGYYGGSWSSSAPIRVFYGSALGLSSGVYDDVNTRGVQWLEVADLDSDGYDDIVAPVYYDGSSHTSSSYVYWGSSSGVNNSDRTAMSSVGPMQSAVGDINGDGYPEIVLGGYHAGAWTSTAYSYLFSGSASGYSSSASATLGDRGVYARPVLVGNTDW